MRFCVSTTILNPIEIIFIGALLIIVAMVIGFLVGTIVTTVSGETEDYDDDDLGAKGKITMALTALIIIGSAVYPLIIKPAQDYNSYVNSEITETLYDNILSLNRESGAYGKFSLGSGTVETKVYYYFYIKEDADTYVINKITDAHIKETDSTHYYVYRVKPSGTTDYTNYIVVPRGTVILTYTA